MRFWSLRVRDECDVCGFDLRRVDTGDGPAVFVTLIGGAIAVFGMLFKGVLVALQFHNKASQA